MDIKIPDKFTVLPVANRADGSIVIAPRRLPYLAIGIPFFIAGMGLWVFQLRDANVLDPSQWFAAILLAAPGMYLLARGLQPRIFLIANSQGLTVKYGFPLCEKQMLHFAPDEFELRTNPLIGEKHRLYVLDARHTGQDAWLTLAGSRLETEVEAARIAILEATGRIGGKSK